MFIWMAIIAIGIVLMVTLGEIDNVLAQEETEKELEANSYVMVNYTVKELD